MSNYYIFAVLLENCSYSINARKLLETNNINHRVQDVSYKDKEKFKKEDYDYYPHIYLRKNNSTESLFLGGYNDLEDFIKIFKNNEYNNDNINNFNKKYYWWSKKAILRFIQLVNET